MTFRPSDIEDLKRKMDGSQLMLCRLKLLITCIQMDADADHGSQERIVTFSVNHEAMQTIIIENPVVNAFRRSSLVIDFFISWRATWHIRIKTNIPIGSCFYDSTIFSG